MIKKLFGRDRRRAERYWFNRSLRLITDSAVIEGQGVCISESGMCVFSLTALPVGARIHIEMPMQGKVLRMPASVRYRAVYLYGIEFTESPQAAEVSL
jgi:hypothetical protein